MKTRTGHSRLLGPSSMVECRPVTRSGFVPAGTARRQRLIRTRIQYGERDFVAPLPVQVKWAGDTAVIVVDNLARGQSSLLTQPPLSRPVPVMPRPLCVDGDPGEVRIMG
jgi:hypothetical protein